MCVSQAHQQLHKYFNDLLQKTKSLSSTLASLSLTAFSFLLDETLILFLFDIFEIDL